MREFAHGNFSGKRLVIFGCGYVGGRVAQQALQRGMRVTALTRNAATAAELDAAGAEVVVADLASAAWHAGVPEQPEYALNTVSSGGGGLEGYRHSYLQGMHSILQWARSHGPVGILVYTSSTSVYPQGSGATVDENAASAGAGERGDVLRETEALLQAAEQSAVRRFFILRLAGIYGPRRHQLLEQVRAGTVAGKGDHRLNLAHRDDVCAAIWSTFGAGPEVASEIFNVADDSPAPKAEVAGWLARRLHVPPPEFTNVPAAGRRMVTPDRIIANAKLKAVLGWRPCFPSFREGYENILSRDPE